MSNEIAVAEAFIYSRLLGDTGLQVMSIDDDRIWAAVAPQGTAEPYIVYQRLAGGDVKALGGARIYSRQQYLIRGIARTESWATLADVADRIDVLFNDVAAVSVADPAGFIESSTRVEPFSLVETPGGVQYRHLGGIYNLAVT